MTRYKAWQASRHAATALALGLVLACAPVPPKPTPAPRPVPPASAPVPVPAPAPVTPRSAETLRFVLPAQGQVIYKFDGKTRKGIGLGGAEGAAVVAAADGVVVYAGADLRGYGNLIILKHNEVFLTAYAHNRALLVREDQTVRQGQKIAEMGSTGSDVTKLHFEIRKRGVAVDPEAFLTFPNQRVQRGKSP